MNKLLAAALLASSVTLPACRAACNAPKCPKSCSDNGPSAVFNDNGASVLKRLSEYYRKSVVTPKLRERWSQLRGAGVVAMEFTYRKSTNSWAFERVTVNKSTLANEQESVALRLMEEFAHSTSFPVDPKEALERRAEHFVVRLAVPVPLPAEGSRLTREQIAIIVDKGDEGDKPVPKCWVCGHGPAGAKCESKSSGAVDCIVHSTNVCSTSPIACLRGLFSGAGGVIMY